MTTTAAVGCPVDGSSNRSANRNNVDDFSAWLDDYHTGHFLVWNLADKRTDRAHSGMGGRESSGGGSGSEVSRKLYERLSGQVLDVPWLSPNRRCYVPSIRHILRLCYSIKVGVKVTLGLDGCLLLSLRETRVCCVPFSIGFQEIYFCERPARCPCRTVMREGCDDAQTCAVRDQRVFLSTVALFCYMFVLYSARDRNSLGLPSFHDNTCSRIFSR